MNTTRFFRTLKVLLFVCIVLLTCVAAVILPERRLSGVPLLSDFMAQAAPTLEPDQTLDDVPLYEQPTSATCGPTAFAMAWNYAHADKALNLWSVITLATKQGWYLPGDSAGVYTSPDHMYDMAVYYANQNGALAPEFGRVSSQQQGVVVLFSQIAMGRPVIVDVNTLIGDTTSPAHFVVVTGISLTQGVVYYNDPFGYIDADEHQAHEGQADWSKFWLSWSSNGDDNGKGNGWYMVVR